MAGYGTGRGTEASSDRHAELPCRALVALVLSGSRPRATAIPCQVWPSGHPISELAVLKASASEFDGERCLQLQGVQIREAGEKFGAWAYT